MFYATPLDCVLDGSELSGWCSPGRPPSSAFCTARSMPIPTLRRDRGGEHAVAHIDAELGRAALRMMERNMGAHLADAADCLG